jgi:hypothetical protein
MAAEEGVCRAVELLDRVDVEVEEAGEGQVDLRDLLQGDALVDAAEGLEILLGEEERRAGAQRRPLLPREAQVRREAVVGPPRLGGRGQNCAG